MEIYRYITADEKEDIIKNKRLQLWQPSRWGKNESVITQIFNFQGIKHYDRDNPFRSKREYRDTILQIKKLVFHYIKAFYSDRDLIGVPPDTECDDGNSSHSLYYDVYTDLMLMLNLSYYTYCKSWSTERDNFDDTQFAGADENNVAYIVADSTIPEKVTLVDEVGHEYQGVARFAPVQYIDFAWSTAPPAIIDSFKKSNRNLSALLGTLQAKYSRQKEYRLIISPNFYDFSAICSFGSYVYQKYDKYVVGDDSDLANALLINAIKIKKYTDSLFIADTQGYKSLFLNLPDGFIKGIVNR